MHQPLLPSLANGGSSWDQALYAFLVAKGSRSGSRRTVDSYSRLLWPFFEDRPPDRVTAADVLAFAYGVGPSGRPPSRNTIGARIACLSSFYKFGIRMGILASNPCDPVERPQTQAAPARGLSADEVRRLLAVVPDTVAGRRDRAILLVLLLTGRRRAEVFDLRAGDIDLAGDSVFYWYRGKGGKRGRRELPLPAHHAICVSLADCGKELTTMDAAESLWQAGTVPRGLSSSTFYNRFRRYLVAAGLPLAGIHITRHAAAKLRRDAGQSIESVSSFLDHSSLAVTSVYLRRLEGVEDREWPEVAAAIGV